MPPSWSMSMIRSSHTKSKLPSVGSMRDQEKMPSDTRLTPASCIRRMSSIHTRSGHWSGRSEEHTSELQSHSDLVCRLLLEKKKNWTYLSISCVQFTKHC